LSTLLYVNLVLVPLLIGGVTLAARRWGPSVGGWLSSFPVISAPILFSIALEHGGPFAASAAVGTLAAVLANLSFTVAYAWCAMRFSWPPCLVAGFAGYFLTVAGLSLWAPSLYVAVPVVLIALLVAPRLYPLPVPTTEPAGKPVNDVFWRMGTGYCWFFSSRILPPGSALDSAVRSPCSRSWRRYWRYSRTGSRARLLRFTCYGAWC
jgi:hypothetical protein